MRRTAAALALIATAALAGCSGGGSSSAAQSTPEPSTPAVATTSPSASETTTPAQWASQIAPLKADYEDAQTAWDESQCSASTVSDDAVCSARLLTMTTTAKTIQITTSGWTMPAATTFIGEPPTEIKSIYAETTDAAETASQSGDAVSCPGDNCVSTAFQFSRDWDALGDALTKWDPCL